MSQTVHRRLCANNNLTLGQSLVFAGCVLDVAAQVHPCSVRIPCCIVRSLKAKFIRSFNKITSKGFLAFLDSLVCIVAF